MIESCDRLVALAPNDDNFIACNYTGNVGNVDDALIHTDATDDGRTLATDQKTEAIAQFAIEAIRVSGGDECETHRLGGAECSVIANDCAWGHGPHADDLRLPTEHGPKFASGLGKRDGLCRLECRIVLGDKPV